WCASCSTSSACGRSSSRSASTTRSASAARACRSPTGRRSRWCARSSSVRRPAAQAAGRGITGRNMSLEQEVELIRQFPIFSKIQPAMQKLLCFSAERLKYDSGQVIFNAGDVGDSAYVIIDGTVEISVPTPSGPIVINNMGKNDLLGEIAIVGEVPRTATAKALTKLETLKIS